MNKQDRSGSRGDSFAGRLVRSYPLPWNLSRATPRTPRSAPAPERRARPRREEVGPFTGIVVSIVVPTCGRSHLLNRCIAALTVQSIDPASYEIIVVDDAPSTETQAVVMNWAARTLGRGPVVGYLASKGPHGPAAARNLGWRAACGEIIAFTDDDTVADRNWLRKGLEAFTRGVQAVSGRVVMPVPDKPTDYEQDAKKLERAEFVTANCFCLKRILDELDGFDARFRLAWREDSDFHFRLLARKARIEHVPEAIVVHPVRPARWGVSLSQQRKVTFDALLYKKHPRLYRERIRSSPRWDYYATVAALAAVPGGLIAGAPEISIAAGGVWTALTARFCAQRLRGTSKNASHVAEMIVTSALIPPLSVFWRIVGAIRFRAPLC